jgi:hypothetical protein
VPLVDGGSVHSEGPIWDRQHGVVRWVDIFAGAHFAYDLERGMLRRSDVGLHLRALATTVEEQLLAAAGDGFIEDRRATRADRDAADRPVHLRARHAAPELIGWRREVALDRQRERRADQDEGEDAVRALEGEQLRERAARRGADQVRRGNLVRVQNPRGVGDKVSPGVSGTPFVSIVRSVTIAPTRPRTRRGDATTTRPRRAAALPHCGPSAPGRGAGRRY